MSSTPILPVFPFLYFDDDNNHINNSSNYSFMPVC